MKKTSNEIITRTLHTAGDLHVREAEGGGESRTITGYDILFNTPSAPLWDDDDEEVRPCPECGGCLHWDGEIWECSNCDYTEED